MSRADSPRSARATPSARQEVVSLREATGAWFRISLQTFGGPAGQIAVMQRALVDEKRWIGQQRFLHALNYCMLLPGPEAQQLAIYTGWLLNGTRGGLVAGGLFVLPGMVALLGLTILYLAAGSTDVVTGLFAGLAPAPRPPLPLPRRGVARRRAGSLRGARPRRDRHRAPGCPARRQASPDPPVPRRPGHGRVPADRAAPGRVPGRRPGCRPRRL